MNETSKQVEAEIEFLKARLKLVDERIATLERFAREVAERKAPKRLNGF